MSPFPSVPVGEPIFEFSTGKGPSYPSVCPETDCGSGCRGFKSHQPPQIFYFRPLVGQPSPPTGLKNTLPKSQFTLARRIILASLLQEPRLHGESPVRQPCLRRPISRVAHGQQSPVIRKHEGAHISATSQICVVPLIRDSNQK